MSTLKQQHNPYLSLIGAIGAFFIAVGVIGVFVNAFSGDGLEMPPTLWIGLGLGTLWLAISAIVYPLTDPVKRSNSQASPARRSIGIKRPPRPPGETQSDPDPST